MIYRLPALADSIDQGDLIDSCPILSLENIDLDNLQPVKTRCATYRVLVLTQTCDLANIKTTRVVVGLVLEANALVAETLLKPADIKGPIRAGRVWGWYFLPKNADLGLPEMIVDLRQLHTVRMDILVALVQRGQRRGRVQPLFREHLARHMAETYARIGLPEPYETEDDRVRTASAAPAPDTA